MNAPAAKDTRVTEAMLLGWTDNQTGRKVTFLLPDETGDHPFKGLKCGPAHGQRLALSVALIDDDETAEPVTEPADEPTGKRPGSQHEPRPATHSETTEAYPIPGQVRVIKQSEIAWRHGGDKQFWRFLCAEYEDALLIVKGTEPDRIWTRESLIKEVLYHLCGVDTRAEFDEPGTGRDAWLNLSSQFVGWKHLQTDAGGRLTKDRAEQRMGEAGE